MRTKILLAGDTMLGRGIDQILPNPTRPEIFEPYVKDAREYLFLAQRVSGKIKYPVSFDYVWGDLLPEITKLKPDLKIINLETTITQSENYLPKGINYRLNPKNVETLRVFGPDICCLANNHILDYGREGLIETINVLKENRIKPVGAGKNLREAKMPARKGRMVVFAFAHYSSGVPLDWQAKENRPGVNLLIDLSDKEIKEIKNEIEGAKKENFIIFSIHWGPNWGYEIDQHFVDFAHRLIDFAGVDLIFGHSSHHFQGLEIYKDKLIIYGAGDFINDYEGIGGFEEFRGNLTLTYFPEIDLKTKKLSSLILVPMKIQKFKLNYPLEEEIDWVLKVLKRESKIKAELIKKDKKIILAENTSKF